MIYGDVYCEDFRGNALFDFSNSRNCDGLFSPVILLRERLLERGIEINTPDVNLQCKTTFELHLDGRKLADGDFPRYLIAAENPLINMLNADPLYLRRFRLVFTWNQAALRHAAGIEVMLPNCIRPPVLRSFDERRIFATLISENKMPRDSRPNDLYAKRLEVIRWYERNAPELFELYGRGWRKPSPAYSTKDKMIRRIGRLRTQLLGHTPFPSWRGEVEFKSSILTNAKFAYCFENVKDLPNYITEKIFDCFLAGCVPIYWGANNVHDYIPGECFIDRRDFKDTEEVHRHLLTVTTREYEQYQQNIAKFLSSTSAKQFSNEHFASTVAAHLAGDVLKLSGM
jgi:hypothetical protein